MEKCWVLWREENRRTRRKNPRSKTRTNNKINNTRWRVGEPNPVTIPWKAAEQYFTVVLFAFQFSPLCNFGTFTNFGIGIVRSERANLWLYLHFSVKEHLTLTSTCERRRFSFISSKGLSMLRSALGTVLLLLLSDLKRK